MFLAGIMIITSYAGFRKMQGFCKTWVPPEMDAEIEAIKDDEAAVKVRAGIVAGPKCDFSCTVQAQITATHHSVLL